MPARDVAAQQPENGRALAPVFCLLINSRKPRHAPNRSMLLLAREPIDLLSPCGKPCVPFLSWGLPGQAVGTPSSGDQGSLRAGEAHLVLITASCCPQPWRVTPFLSDVRSHGLPPVWQLETPRADKGATCHHKVLPACTAAACWDAPWLSSLPQQPVNVTHRPWGPKGSHKSCALGNKDAWCWVLHSQMPKGRIHWCWTWANRAFQWAREDARGGPG